MGIGNFKKMIELYVMMLGIIFMILNGLEILPLIFGTIGFAVFIISIIIHLIIVLKNDKEESK